MLLRLCIKHGTRAQEGFLEKVASAYVGRMIRLQKEEQTDEKKIRSYSPAVRSESTEEQIKRCLWGPGR